MRINEEGWRLLTFWMFTTGGYLILLFVVICPAFLFQTPRRVLLWMALPQIALVLLLWFAADDETLFFPIGAGWMLGLSLLLALLVSHRLRQPHHLWAGCHVVVLLLLLAHMGIFSRGIIGAMPIRHSRWRKKRCYEKSIRLMTAFF